MIFSLFGRAQLAPDLGHHGGIEGSKTVEAGQLKD
jgi:hypothetical protein